MNLEERATEIARTEKCPSRESPDSLCVAGSARLLGAHI